MKEQKCNKCKTWNTNEIRCTNCDAPLVAEEVNKDYRAKLDLEDAEKPKSKGELLLISMKQSPNFLVKGLYFFLASISAVYFFLVSMVLFIVATLPG